MRVALLSHTYVERENRKKLEAVAARGVEITLFVPELWVEGALDKTWRAETKDPSGLRVVSVPVRRLVSSPAAAWWQLRQLRSDLQSGVFDLLHVEEEPWSFVAFVCGVAARRAKIPSVIFTWQNLPNHPVWPLRVLSRVTLRRYSGWVAGNQAAVDLLRRVDPDHPLTVLPQLGIDKGTVARPRIPNEKLLRVGFVGRLVEEKGIGDLLDALAKVNINWHLTLIGDGPAREELKRQATSLGIANRVDFKGSVPHDEVENVWPELDVMVLPSRTTQRWAEQFGHVLVEAMAHAVVVVGSSSGAIPEVIGDGGIVVPERDVEALAKVIEQLGSDAQKRDSLRDAAEARAADFSNERLADSLISFWTQILAGAAR